MPASPNAGAGTDGPAPPDGDEPVVMTQQWLEAFNDHMRNVDRMDQEGALQQSYTPEALTEEMQASHRDLVAALRNTQDLRSLLWSVLPSHAERQQESPESAAPEGSGASSHSSSGQQSISRGYSLSGSNPGPSSENDENAPAEDAPGSAGNDPPVPEDFDASDASETSAGYPERAQELPSASPRQAASPHSATKTSCQQATTLIVHNSPECYTQSDLMREWELVGSCDFFHLRWSNSTRRRERLAIINFVSPEAGARFRERWHGLIPPQTGSKEPLSIKDNPVQGMEANLMMVRDDTPVLPMILHDNQLLSEERVAELIRFTKGKPICV